MGAALKADRAEIALLGLAFKFATSLAANVVWGRQLYSRTLPFCCGALLSGSGSVKCKRITKFFSIQFKEFRFICGNAALINPVLFFVPTL